jgi:hypothetical protein
VSRYTNFITARKDFLRRDVGDRGERLAAFFRIVMNVAPGAWNRDDATIILMSPFIPSFRAVHEAPVPAQWRRGERR